MKLTHILTFIIVICSSMTYGQDSINSFLNEDIPILGNIIAKPGELYIDTIKVKAGKCIIHIDNIKKIENYKGKSAEYFSGARGAIVITRKKKYELQSLSVFLENIKKENKQLESEESIDIYHDNTLIEDISDYQIELNPNIKIEVRSYHDEGVYHGGSKNKPKTQILITTSK